MKSFFKIVFGSMVGFLLFALLWTVLLLIVLGGMMSSFGEKTQSALKEPTILNIELSAAIEEREVNNPMALLMNGNNKPTGLNMLLKNIAAAKDDEHIKGIVLRPGMGVTFSAAHAEELRKALADFKKSGKFIYTYAELYGHNMYWISTVADTIGLQPEGTLEFRGLSMQQMFFKGVLDKVGVEMQIIRHGKFKSAVEPFTQKEMSPANREQNERMINSIWERVAEDVAEGRGLSREQVEEAAREYYGMFPEQALEHGLIDMVVPVDQFTALLMNKMGVDKEDDLEMISLSDYNAIEKPMVKTSDKIAVIYANGEIGMDKGDDTKIGLENIAQALKDAADDEKVKAIVLRVNSPGGSVLTSDVIYQEVLRAKAKKPLVASFGAYAASGGYYISCAADRIFAQNTTITGSIGVFGMIPNAAKAAGKVGLTFDEVRTHPYAGMPTITREMTTAERALQQRSVEEVYAGFIAKVGAGRKMSTEAVDSIGQGRVWSGADGLRIGLVDEIGSLSDAIAYAAKKAKVEKYKVADYPKQKTSFELLMDGLSGMRAEKVTKALIEEMGEEGAALYRTLEQLKESKKGVIMARMPYGLVVE